MFVLVYLRLAEELKTFANIIRATTYYELNGERYRRGDGDRSRTPAATRSAFNTNTHESQISRELLTIYDWVQRPIPTEMLTSILLLFIAAIIIAQPPTVIPRLPKDIPPGFEEVLPADIVQRLKEVHQNRTLTAEQQHEHIDGIMTSLPNELLVRLPSPPGFERLPLSIRDELKEIHRDKKLNWRQRHDKIRSVIDALPQTGSPASASAGPWSGPPPMRKGSDLPFFLSSSIRPENKPFYV